MTIDLIIHHADCPDGFCAAFVAKKKYPDAELLGQTYGMPLPLTAVLNKNVLVVDFSWKRDECLMLKNAAKGFQILDHHKTAQSELDGLDFATFDMGRSGATLTWDTLFPDEPRPWYVNYVEDRDLWRWALPDSKSVSGYIMALPHTIEAWTRLDTIDVWDAAQMGAAIRLHIDHYIEKVVAQQQEGHWDELCQDGLTVIRHSIAVVNAAYPNISDVGNELCKNAEIGLGWFERGDGMMQFSLRSVGNLDVSVWAKQHGGGGHKNAAGFQVPYAQGRKILDEILGRE